MHADFSRNRGFLSEVQQQALFRAKVAICGLGGMGAVALESLARMGLGAAVIVDPDHFEATDINRHVHGLQSTVGKKKRDVIASRMRDINPAMELVTVEKVDCDTAANIVDGVDLIINTMDCLLSSIILEREARKRGKTMVDSWINPFPSVFVIKPEAPHWEEFLHFPTKGVKIEEITPELIVECQKRQLAFTNQQFKGSSIVDPHLVADILAGRRPIPSLVPVIWLSGVLVANEAMKLLTNQGRLANHWGVFYDQYGHRVRYLNWDGECP